MSLKKKLIILLIAFTLIPLATFGVVIFSHARTVLQSVRIAQLNNIADLKKDKIETFFSERTADIRSTQNYLVEIFDEGTGLGDQDPEELFQPFVTTKTRGTGLGLPVSRQIVERLGGTIDIRNREPRGAVCRIILPAHVSSIPDRKAVAAAAKG